MRAISLIEPWASLVAHGLKRFETRSWGTGYRGPMAIHASKSREAVAEPGYVEGLFEAAGLPVPALWPRRPEDYPLGRVVAVTALDGCWRMTPEGIAARSRQEAAFGAWSEGRFAWAFGAVRLLARPVPCRGALGVWVMPADVRLEVEAQAA